ncbi:MAG: FAD-dependent oxidoreductase [Rickettsiales bacterium]|nr:FAD-dependent oxidoreductase [Rickettsiales bacterium]
MASQKTYHIIGAGISGLIIAHKFLMKGIKVNIYEASPFAGGRCRSFNNNFLDCHINNGNHLVLGANKNFLEILKVFNIEKNFYKTSDLFEIYNFESKKKIGKFSVYFELIKFIFAVLLGRKSNNKFYKLIAESITNTRFENFDIKILRNVIIEILKSGLRGLDFIQPKTNWQDAFIKPILEDIKNKNGSIFFSKSVNKINFDNGKASEILFADGEIIKCENDTLISTIPAYNLKKIANINCAINYNPIINIHIKTKNILPSKIIAIYSDFADWIFCNDNIISITKSVPNDLSQKFYDDKNFLETLKSLVKKSILEEIEIENYLILNEKRATIDCEKESLEHRPNGFTTEYSNLFICGDFVENNLPSTIEGTIKNALNLTKQLSN